MWRYAEELMIDYKVKRPGEFTKNNIHGGRMWGSMKEWRDNRLTEDQIGKIILRCHKNGASKSTLVNIRKFCSYLWNLETGIPGENYPMMNGIFKCMDMKLCPKSRGGVRPLVVPTANQLKLAFTTNYRPGCGMSVLDFIRGTLIAWDYFVLGNRPEVDLNKIKKSVEHHVDNERKICSTKFPGGRSKLVGNKKGMRKWWAHRVCMCPKGQHVSPDKGLAFSFDRWGNTRRDVSKYCLTCPFFCFELLQESQSGNLLLYRNWIKSESRTRKGRSRWGAKSVHHPQDEAIKWMSVQGVPNISKNSGRKTCSKWSSATNAPFVELVHVVGDNEDVWRDYYQKDLPETHCKIREQSEDLDVATAALRRFRSFCGRGPPPEPIPQGLNRAELGSYPLLRNLGFMKDAKRIFG